MYYNFNSMTPNISYSYDKEADILYVSFAPGEAPTAAVELNDNILLRFNRAEKRAIGLTLMDFSVLVQLTSYSPTAAEVVPITSVERPPLPLAA